MSKQPEFEIDPNHEFKSKEKVYLIDTNGYDIWEAKITAVDGNKYTVQLLEDRKHTETVEGTERLLAWTRANTKICKEQDIRRASNNKASSESDEAEEDADEEEGPDFVDDDDEPSKGKKQKKPSKSKKNASKPSKPSGTRSNPRRGA